MEHASFIKEACHHILLRKRSQPEYSPLDTQPFSDSALVLYFYHQQVHITAITIMIMAFQSTW